MHILAHYPVKPFGVYCWLSLCLTLLAPDALASITITRFITDNIEESRQYSASASSLRRLLRLSYQSAERFAAHDTPMARLTRAIPVLWQQERVRYPFSRLTVLHGFFQDLDFHRLLAQKVLKLPDTASV
jgi:hypothetical protein